MFDINSYQADASAQRVTVSKNADGTFNVSKKQYDADTGSKLADDTVAINLTEYQNQLATTQQSVSNLKALISACQAL